MNALESNQYESIFPLSEKTDDCSAKPETKLTLSFAKNWTQRLALIAALSGIGGCATIPQIRPDTETADSKQTLLRIIGATEDGEQPDGSEVQFGEGATKEEAKANAKAIIEMLLEGDVIFDEPKYIRISKDKVLAIVHGKKAEKKIGSASEASKIIKKILLKKLGIKKDGAQPDGNEVQFGEGATRQEAIENAKAIIEMLHEGEKLTYSTHTIPMGNTWMAVAKGIVKKPKTLTLKKMPAYKPSKKETAAFYAQSNGNEATVKIREGINIYETFFQIDQECIDYYVEELKNGPFATCQGRAFKLNPDRERSGKLKVTVRADRQGKIKQIKINMKTKGVTSTEGEKIKHCVISNVKRWPLPKKPKGKSDKRNFSFELFF